MQLILVSFYNGPFKMTEWWKHGDEMILSKNENYWDADSIKLDEICVKTVADAKDSGCYVGTGRS